jgi:hypothetical protein
VKEQSHKSEMRAALRGDFERLRARRGKESTLIEPSAPPEQVVAEPQTGPEPEPCAPTVANPDGGSWLDRLRGRA